MKKRRVHEVCESLCCRIWKIAAQSIEMDKTEDDNCGSMVLILGMNGPLKHRQELRMFFAVPFILATELIEEITETRQYPQIPKTLMEISYSEDNSQSLTKNIHHRADYSYRRTSYTICDT